jgi:hypothetical protein
MALARSFEAAGRHAAAAELILLPDAPAAAPPAIGASPLCDAPRIGANLARFLRGAWHGWCAGEDAAAAATVTAAGQGNARVRALAPA